MVQDENERSQKMIRINEQTYNRLSTLGSVKDSFNDVIEQLLNCYEIHNGGLRSSSFQMLIEMFDFPVDEQYKQYTLKLFNEILKLGENVSYALLVDAKEQPFIESRKNKVIFFKGTTAFCLIRTPRRDSSYLYFPTESKDTNIPGWKDGLSIVDEYRVNDGLKQVIRSFNDR